MSETPERSFDAFAKSGRTIATVRLRRRKLKRTVSGISKRFRLPLRPSDGLYEQLLWGLRFAAGSYWHERNAITRAELLKRLSKMTAAAKWVANGLRGADEGFADEYDLAVYKVLAEVIHARQPDLDGRDVRRLVSSLRENALLTGACFEAAEALVLSMQSKKGQRGLGWYERFVDVMLEAAATLQMPVTTGGDRTEDPHATPFTMLAWFLEQSLPKSARSKTLMACAKRLQESLARRNVRGNRP